MEKACGLHCTKINNISVKIGNEEILKNVSIHVHCGELTVIIGRNGAGKTTLLKAILGEIEHTGSISFVDKIIFGRLHYNKLVSQYKGYKEYYNNLANQVIKFCEERNIEYHIKEKTITEIQNA